MQWTNINFELQIITHEGEWQTVYGNNIRPADIAYIRKLVFFMKIQSTYREYELEFTTQISIYISQRKTPQSTIFIFHGPTVVPGPWRKSTSN